MTMTTSETIQEQIDYLRDDTTSEEEFYQSLCYIVELCAGKELSNYIDVCSICGSAPMTTNCNNAGCDE